MLTNTIAPRSRKKTETWEDSRIFFFPPRFLYRHSPSLSFSFSCTLFHSSLARSFTPSSSSCASSSLFSHSPHITSLSSPLPSLSFLFTFILPRKKKTHPFPLSSLLPCYSVLSFSPLPNSTLSPATSPFMSRLFFVFYLILFFGPFSSSSSPPAPREGAALISSAETLSSLRAGINHSPFHT